MEIRLVEPGEFDRVADIVGAAYTPSGLPDDDPYWADLADVVGRTRDAEVWVAADDGCVLGTLTWTPPGSSQREIATDDEAEFRMFAVWPEAQGRGVGRALLAAALARARRDGFVAVTIYSADWMSTAHRLYERTGFVREPERDWQVRPDVRLRAYRLAL